MNGVVWMSHQTELKNDSQDTKAFVYKKLTPVVASIKPYIEQINYIFSDNEIRNIAITGPYGSGKSSLMRGIIKHYGIADRSNCYDDFYGEVEAGEDDTDSADNTNRKDNSDDVGKRGKHEKHRFMMISLTHFGTKESEKTEQESLGYCCPKRKSKKVNNENNQQYESTIEGQIINQIVHRVDKRDIPKSRFTKTGKSTFGSRLLIAVYIVFTLLYFLSFSQDLIPSFSDFGISLRSAATLVWAFSSIVLVFYLSKRSSPKRVIKKVGFQGSEIELFNDDQDSKFDRYMDDIIYAIHESGSDVIVFEDLDRFNMPEVFVKLREINDLVNETRKRERQKFINRKARKLEDKLAHLGRFQRCVASQIERSIVCKTKEVRFFYLVCDDLFSSKDRTKFFDYMLPIIPHMDYSNAYQEISDRLNRSSCRPSQQCLKDLAPFLDEKRLADNIVNEFYSYAEALQLQRNNYDEEHGSKLFGLMVYKNLFPKDFQKLQHNEGLMARLFAQKSDIEILLREKLEEKINVCRANYDSQYQKVYREALLNRFKTDSRVIDICQTNNIDSELNSLDTETDLNAWIDDQGAEVSGALGSRLFEMENLSLLDQAELKVAREKRELDFYLDRLKDISKSGIKDLILLCEEEGIEDFGGWYLDEIEDCSQENEVNEKILLVARSLVLNGYIDETYRNFISYFKPGTFTLKDHDFLMRVSAFSRVSPNTELDNPIEVLSEIDRSRFAGSSVYVYRLAKYLFDDEVCSRIFQVLDKRKAFLSSLGNNDGAKFLVGFACSKHQNCALYQYAVREGVDLTNMVFDESCQASDAEKSEYAIYLYKGLYNDPLFSEWEKINEFAFSNEVFLSLRSEKTEEGVQELLDAWTHLEKMQKTRLRFVKINYELVNQKVLKFVYLNGLYEPNSEIVLGIIKYQLGVKSCNINNVMSVVVELEDAILKDKISSEIDFVLKDLLAHGWLEKEEKVIKWIINSTNISKEVAAGYIQALPELCIADSTKYSNSYKEMLFENKLVKPTFKNAIDYYLFKTELSSDVVSFFAAVDLKSISDECIQDMEKNTLDELMNSLLFCEGIPANIFSAVLEKTGYRFSELDYEYLAERED